MTILHAYKSPFQKFYKILSHLKNFQCQIILFRPQWPMRHRYTDLLQMLIDILIKKIKVFRKKLENIILLALCKKNELKLTTILNPERSAFCVITELRSLFSGLCIA